MKTEYWILLALGAYWLYSRSGTSAATPMPYPPVSRSTGSGGTISIGGIGISLNNPPIGGIDTNPSWSYPPSWSSPDYSGYITCNDGTLVNDISLCP
jgi:hypothetical protein